MAPLSLETYSPDAKKWLRVGLIGPGAPPGSVSDNRDGRRDVYVFSCASDNSHSVIQRSVAGVDREIGPLRAVTSVGAETVKVLKTGETYEMEVRTDMGREPRRIRFRHF
jgi:hypothetical protein